MKLSCSREGRNVERPPPPSRAGLKREHFSRVPYEGAGRIFSQALTAGAEKRCPDFIRTRQLISVSGESLTDACCPHTLTSTGATVDSDGRASKWERGKNSLNSLEELMKEVSSAAERLIEALDAEQKLARRCRFDPRCFGAWQKSRLEVSSLEKEYDELVVRWREAVLRESSGPNVAAACCSFS